MKAAVLKKASVGSLSGTDGIFLDGTFTKSLLSEGMRATIKERGIAMRVVLP